MRCTDLIHDFNCRGAAWSKRCTDLVFMGYSNVFICIHKEFKGIYQYSLGIQQYYWLGIFGYSRVFFVGIYSVFKHHICQYPWDIPHFSPVEVGSEALSFGWLGSNIAITRETGTWLWRLPWLLASGPAKCIPMIQISPWMSFGDTWQHFPPVEVGSEALSFGCLGSNIALTHETGSWLWRLPWLPVSFWTRQMHPTSIVIPKVYLCLLEMHLGCDP